jgi:hypothetical protein
MIKELSEKPSKKRGEIPREKRDVKRSEKRDSNGSMLSSPIGQH